MEEIMNLNTKLDEILSNAGDISLLGYDDLKNLWQQIDELKNEANTLAENMLVGVTRQPNGRFKGKADIEFDINEIATFTTAIDKFTDRAYSEISHINMIERDKKEQFNERGKRVIELNRLMRTNESLISNLKSEISDLRNQLGDANLISEMLDFLESNGITYTPSESNLTPERKYFLEQKLNAALHSLDTFEKANEMYKIEEEKLREEMNILKNGGILNLEPEVLDIDEPTLDTEEEIISSDGPKQSLVDEDIIDVEEELDVPSLDISKEAEEENELGREPQSDDDILIDEAYNPLEGETPSEVEELPPELDTEDEKVVEDEMEEEPQLPKVVNNKPKLTWKTVASVAAGIGIGATVFFTVGPVGVGVMSLAGGLAKKFINNKRKEYAKMRKAGLKNVEELRPIRPGFRGKIDKFVNYLKSEEGLRDMSWMINAAIFTGVGLSVGSAIHSRLNSAVSTKSTSVAKPDVALDASNEMGYDGIRIGDSVGQYNVTTGHDTASWAVDGLNPEALNSAYVNEGSIFNRFAAINSDGSIGQIIDTKGLSITEFCAQNGIDPTQIAVDVANKNGTSQAWVAADQLISGMGGPKI